MEVGNNKKAQNKDIPASTKMPRFGALSRGEYPCWHFGSIDWDGPFSKVPCEWECISLKNLVEGLKPFECSKWSEILAQQSRGNKRHGFIDCGSICSDAQRRLKEINQDDVDQLFHFRLTSGVRCWGIVDRHTFKMLWWDPKHDVYPINLSDN